MTETVPAALPALMIAVPGLLILAWAGMSLLFWAQNQESRLPFERNVPDQGRLALAGVDLIHGLSTVVASFLFQLYYVSVGSDAPFTALWVCWLFAVVYPFVYFRFLRPLFLRVRLAQRNSAPPESPGP